MQIRCPECQSALELDDSKAGKSVRCRFCGHKFVAEYQLGPVDAAPPAADTSALEQLAEASEQQVAKAAPPSKHAGPFISPMKRASVVLVFCSLGLILSCAVIWSSISQVDLLHRIEIMNRLVDRNPDADEDELLELFQAEGALVTEEEIEANDNHATIVGLSFLAVFITFFITYLVWKYRVYKNLYPLESQQIRFSPAGAVGWYFCPILQIWRPCQVMNDIWLGSNPGGIGNIPRAASGFVLLWWIAWLTDGIISQVSFRMMPKEDATIKALIDSTWLNVYANIAGIASLLLTIVIIWLVSKRQIERHNRLTTPVAEVNPYATDVVGPAL